MSKDPSILFYTSDFLTGTAFFTDAEKGQYIRLLCEQHQIGHIPENHMVSVCLSLGSPVVKKFAIDNEGMYFNVRMEEEIRKRAEFTESRRVNGLKGGRPKDENKPLAKPLGLPTENLVGNENINDNIDGIKGGVGGKDFISLIVEAFKMEYEITFNTEYLITNVGKERSAAGKLLKIHTDKNPGLNSQERLESIHNFFKLAVNVDDDWIRDHMSLSIVHSKINDIIKILKHGNKRTKGRVGVTDEQLAGIVANNFATDRP